MTTENDPYCCSFCDKSQYDVVKLIAGPSVFICNECVTLCEEIMFEERVQKAARDLVERERLVNFRSAPND